MRMPCRARREGGGGERPPSPLLESEVVFTDDSRSVEPQKKKYMNLISEEDSHLGHSPKE